LALAARIGVQVVSGLQAPTMLKMGQKFSMAVTPGPPEELV